MMNTLNYIILFSLLGGVISLLGGIILLMHKRLASGLASFAAPFAAGALLGAAFFDILPEALELADSHTVLNAALLGMIIFFVLERFLHWFHHHHEHGVSHSATATLVIIGDTLHNAIDGVAIATAFLVSVPTGIITTIAIAAHEIPQEIGDFGLLLKSGMRRFKVIMVNIVSALATLVAALMTYYLGNQWPEGTVLGLTAGFFIYIAASDIIPTIHMSTRKRFAKLETILLLMGVVLVWVTTELAHVYVG